MSFTQDALSWLYYIVFVMYAYASSLSGRITPQTSKTRVLTAALTATTIWAMVMSLSNAAPDAHTALVIRKIGVFGWGTIFSLTVHLFLVVTGKNRLLKTKWVYFAMYTPAVLNILVFLVRWKSADYHYHIFRYSFGWTNLWVNTFWNWFHTIQFIVSSVLCVGLAIHWFFTTRDKHERMQAKWLSISMSVTILLGAATDFITKERFDGLFPQLGIVFTMFPILTILYLIRKYEFIEITEVVEHNPNDQILHDADRENLYTKIGYITHSMAFLNLGYRVLVMKDFSTTNFIWFGLVYSAFILLCGIAVIYSKSWHLSVMVQEAIITAVLVILIFISLLHYGDRGAITVWAFVFILITISAVFSNHRVMLTGAVILAVVQLMLAISNQVSVVIIEDIDYLLRVVAIGICAGLTIYVNRIYRRRLRESVESFRFQKALTDLSAVLRVTSEETYNDSIVKALNIIAQYMENKNAIHLEIGGEGFISMCHHNDCMVNDPEEKGALARQAYQSLMNKYAYYEQGSTYFVDCDQYEPDSDMGKYLRAYDIHSVMFSPFAVKNNVTNVLLVELKAKRESLQQITEDFFHIAANDLAGFFIRYEAEKELTFLAFHDVLTGLLKRDRFIPLVEDLLKAAGPEEQVYVMFMDVDAFKDVNDTAGHYIGNQVIRIIADRLLAVTRPQDLLARYGGDEFLYATLQSSQSAVSEIAERLLSTFIEPIRIEKMEFYLSASLGIAYSPEAGNDAVTLLNNADFAMYEAKHNSDKKYAYYSTERKNEAYNMVMLKNSLRNALDNGEFFLVYQPQVNLLTGRVAGLEALLRWRHPVLGVISPAVFIPIAEQTGQIISIGAWVLREACRQAQAWIDSGYGPLRIGVNFTFHQLQNGSLVDIVRETLEETGLRAENLEMEVTESTTGMYGERILGTISELKRMGVSLAIDDYGSDYSAMRRLSVFAVDRIKIDKSLIDNILAKDPKRRVIVQIIIELARELKLAVTAEGVESEEQAIYLREAGCDEIQGFLFYRPMPADQAEAVLAQQAWNMLPPAINPDAKLSADWNR